MIIIRVIANMITIVIRSCSCRSHFVILLVVVVVGGGGGGVVDC